MSLRTWRATPFRCAGDGHVPEGSVESGIDNIVWGRENPMRLPTGSHGKARTEQGQALSWVELRHWEGRERMGMGSEEQ